MSYAFAAPFADATRVCASDTVRPGLALGTMILTKLGERPVESLRPGDKVITRDHGFLPLRWVGISTSRGPAPVHITANALGQHQAITVSASTRFLIRGSLPLEIFGETEVIARADDLVNGRSVFHLQPQHQRFVHLLLDRKSMLRAAGMEVESLDPAEHSLDDCAQSVSSHLHLVPHSPAAQGYGLGQCLAKTEIMLLNLRS